MFDMKFATVTGCESENNSIFSIPLEVWKIRIFSCMSQSRVSFSQKYWVFSSVLYPQQFIKNKNKIHKKLLENFRTKSILFPPDLHLETLLILHPLLLLLKEVLNLQHY